MERGSIENFTELPGGRFLFLTSNLVLTTAARKNKLPDCLYLVGCSREKLAGTHAARDLYTSTRFTRARKHIERIGAPWAILSGKHGLVSPKTKLATYDVDLSKQSATYLREWSATVLKELEKLAPTPRMVVVLADVPYYAGWAPALEKLGHRIHIPGRTGSSTTAEAWLETLNSPRTKMLKATYAILDRLRDSPAYRPFEMCKGSDDWPNAGVYVYYDPAQKRVLEPPHPKIVRIGTHGVSDGSISTLWQRLKAHKGDLNGLGNHRTSIFRLHIGTALIAANRLQCPSWGSTARPSPDELEAEKEIERAVSEYIGRLHISVLPIIDEASKRSDRAYVEQNLIAIMSGLPCPIECASESWLGYRCENPAVVRSSLWNVNHTEENFDPGFLPFLESFVTVAMGQREPTTKSLAPPNWYESSQHGYSQTFLF